jgi:lipopolysaccharide biosynthesis glycosyltransferase|tara:strand:- start:729 stop:1487 length:759 start_codon:yes stop_codon:yes gene_type:complete
MSSKQLKIYIGYDSRQLVSYTVLQHSIIKRSKSNISISPLVLDNLPIKRHGLTPFTFSRYLLPWLNKYEGWAIFLDADMLLLDDISKLFEYKNDKFAVIVRKDLPKFEWPSVILFNCSHKQNKKLTPQYVDDKNNNNLQDFGWIDNNKLIGTMPKDWNHCVGYDETNKRAKLIHFTMGIPEFSETKDCEYAKEWFEEKDDAMCVKESWNQIMGTSIHAVTLPGGKRLPKLHSDAKRHKLSIALQKTKPKIKE